MSELVQNSETINVINFTQGVISNTLTFDIIVTGENNKEINN
jgi:hypothetical protein